MSLSTPIIEYVISIQSETNLSKEMSEWIFEFKLKGDRSEINFSLSHQLIRIMKKVSAANTNCISYLHEFRISEKDTGKIKQLELVNFTCQEKEVYLIEIQVKNIFRDDQQLFPIDKPISPNTRLVLRPNLKPGENGIFYVITTHTGNKQMNKSNDLNISFQIIGDKAKTKFIRLQHSQLNKQAFICGKKDIFEILANDVGRTTKVVIANQSEPNPNNSWFVDNFEVKNLKNSETSNFAVNKILIPAEEIVLFPMSICEILYQVVLRLNDMDGLSSSNKHLVDVYFVIKGAKGRTKKIYLNNYETKRQDHHDQDPKEKYFEFKSDDVGKIEQINLSINPDNTPDNFIFIDFIEIKIPIRSEAYKFPIDRVLGEYFEDGKCELDLEVWKHPERHSHIDYEILSETGPDQNKEAKGKVYLIIYGDICRTGKIELNDGSFENSLMDNYEFSAPDVGKITKIEIFYIPLNSDSEWHLEAIQIKVACRNEAYKYVSNTLLVKCKKQSFRTDSLEKTAIEQKLGNLKF
ncbi:lipoxygenase homology domain-containing 1-like [Brachionus plicatilis]|uniref:Lipoxygenase homology domain-containing 1-like n=1 Tax=Brachionus plicatilis TaxID=10195 RepID=A0A3M7PTD9_BRAPC|nr:lipoxygenase homology domain-containing 1-like [Brachionus plicatilis]